MVAQMGQCLTLNRQLHGTDSLFPEALQGHRDPSTACPQEGQSAVPRAGCWWVRLGTVRQGQRVLPEQPPPASAVPRAGLACPQQLQQCPGKLHCSQATIPKTSPKFPPQLFSPSETLLLFGDSPRRWEGTGLCWEVTASLGGARAGATQPAWP